MRVLVYGEWDLTSWRAEGLADRRPGLAPYGMEHLAFAPGVDMYVWNSSRLLRACGAERARRFVEHRTLPFVRQGMLARAGPNPDVAIAVLEKQGYAHALLKSLGAMPWAKVPLVLVSCWLAERARLARGDELRLLRRIARAADIIVFWSSNQAELLSNTLGVDQDRLFFVPFGIENEFYRPTVPSSGYVFTAGRDAGRDYKTLFEAANLLDVQVKIVCPPELVSGLPRASNIEVVGEVDHVAYRDLLSGAGVVALASNPDIAYPTGQTVWLNAMAVGRPTVITDTPALRDYTRHGENTWLVKPRDPDSLAAGISRVLADHKLRKAMTDTASIDVKEKYTAKRMWQAVAHRLTLLSERP